MSMKLGSTAGIMSDQIDGKKLLVDTSAVISKVIPIVCPTSTQSEVTSTSTTDTTSGTRTRTRFRRKLKDHKIPVQGRVQRLRVVLAHKRAICRNFVRNHIRRIHELYYLSHVGGNFLDSINLLNMKTGEKPKELLMLLEKYRLSDDMVPAMPQLKIGTEQEKSPEKQTPKSVPNEKSSEKFTPDTVHQPLEKSSEKQTPDTVYQPQEKSPKAVHHSPEKSVEKQISKIIHQPYEKSSEKQNTKTVHQSHEKSPEKFNSRGPKKFSEKLKAEAAVVQRVTELQKEGMWYDRRLPKCHDQQRLKTHWDYLLEEMQWLAVDFAVEKKWKRIAARKCARMVEKYYADKKLAEEKAKKDEKTKVQKIAAFMAKEVRNFWSNVRKLVEYKEQSKIEELRKKTMDQHLSFIVDQTEKISSMLAETFSSDIKPHRLALENELVPESLNSLKVFDDGMVINLSDDEFLPSFESEDDEETIALAEREAKDVKREVDLLKIESEMSIDDILDDLPLEYVQQILHAGVPIEPKKEETTNVVGEAEVKYETDYEPSGSESDLEDTILEEEKMAATVPNDSAAELKELEEDNMLTVDQLRAKYMNPIVVPVDSDNDSTENMETEEESDPNESDEEDDMELSENFGEGDDTNSAEDQEQQSSLATLLQTFAPERAGEDHGDDELNSVAAMAESFQPTGYTLSSTSVATNVPPLLKHTLREYQHIGLDWLVTMYDKRLNGILADEMGLGKTIQTIALLAHLACEKENWGPHLIIVPTSVMLNWEMEFLKWVPGFKVLTYYGSIKERKAKRTGWTKPNTFHVCITSYKILIQDHNAFRRKRWKYLILDEAQNIKNFKSQRWQLLLNFSTQRRLLLTGTPLQNNLMELWSLMHFLMPNVFQSHREFRQWFSNPMTGMIEGNSEYNENIIKRLHKVLRPFILRRLKSEVEKQLPQKYEHIVLCRLSKRQRYLYEDFMSRTKTKETLQTGSLLSVINVLMQLRKVCNHPNLFEPRPIISPLQTRGFPYEIPSLVWNMRDDEKEKTVSFNIWNLTRDELSLDKQTAKKIRSLVAKNYRLTVRHCRGNPIMESISFPSKVSRMNSFKNVIDLNHKTDGDIVIPTDGDEDCSIIFEHKTDPSTVRKRLYTFQKSVVPNPPRLRTPFALFTVDMKPSDALVEDKEFLAGIRQDLSQAQSLSLSSSPPSAKFIRRDGVLEVVNPRKKGRNRPTKRRPRVTKLSTSQYPMKLATTINGSDVIVTTNCVCVVKSEPKQSIKTTTVPYASFGMKRKYVTEVEDRKSLLDTVVVDFEDTPEMEPMNNIPETHKEQVIPLAKRNGLEGEDKEICDDSGGEGKVIVVVPPKVPRLDSPERRKVREQSGSPRKGTKHTELDLHAGMPAVPSRKRKQSSITRSTKAKRRRLDLTNIEFEEVVYRRLCDRKAVISNLRAINNRRLLVHTVYGADLIQQVECIGVMPKLRYFQKQNYSSWKRYSCQPEERDHDTNGYFHLGYHEVMLVKRMKMALSTFEENHSFHLWRHTRGLLDVIWTLTDIMGMLENIIKRFIIYTPAVSAPRILERVFHPSISRFTQIQTMEHELGVAMKEPLEPLRPIFSAMSTQFPDPRLIQYDCGKLQVLDGLLRRLKLESHRVLIFTQMAKMLDVLEAFLNHHGYIYLRLDGATKIDQRQLLMERFNTDKRIFCFILSTRSGGIGVNLTGADTVIFYDSDWNPTMDAQAQDRCHRIGQTRDVHIYRLVSEKTVEENILKKSNQKKLLGELAIEGGNFTTAYFKKNTIHDIFDVDEREGDAKKRMAEILETPVPSPQPFPETSKALVTATQKDENAKTTATYILESALAVAEDEFDVEAARTVKAEAAAELAEFDEDIPLDDDCVENEDPSHIDQEMDFIMNELSNVELYALRFMESTIDDWSKDTFANAQKELEIQKLEWELEQQQNDSELIFGNPAPLLTVEEQLEDILTYPMVPQVTTEPLPSSTEPKNTKKKRRRIRSGQGRSRARSRRRSIT